MNCMKKIFIFLTVCMSVWMTSCDYLNVDDYFEDTFKEDSIFANKRNIQRYFNGAAAMLPVEGKIWQASNVPGVTATDEGISCGSRPTGIFPMDFPGTLLTIDQISSTVMGSFVYDLNIWPTLYKIIRKVNVLLPRIDEVPDMSVFDKIELRSQARFLRAYAYYWLIQSYGPCILVGDEILSTNASPDYYAVERNTFDECVEYVCKELEEASDGLELKQPNDLLGRPTKGAALALAARLRLWAASPLYNGGAAARKYFGNFTRKSDGANYISQTYDDSKWAKAAALAKRVMDLGVYSLYTAQADQYTRPLPAELQSASNYPDGPGGIDPFKSYSDIFTGQVKDSQNPELIWGRNSGGESNGNFDDVFPTGLGGHSDIAVSQRIIDAYYMADGRSIENASTACPYEARPYDNSCVVNSDEIISENYTLKNGTYKAYANREARFYASIGFSGCLWPFESTTESSKRNIIVKYHDGADYGKSRAEQPGYYNLTGYVCKKYVHYRDAKVGEGARTETKTFPIIRYAEVLMIYAEALNNLQGSHTVGDETFTRDTEKIKKAFNLIRYRAGLPGVTDSQLASAETFNQVLQREKMIEFIHENHRYYDVRRWGILEDLEKQPLTGMNVEAKEWTGFYAPVIINHRIIRERVFKPKMMLLPIHHDELRKVPSLDQNPGWEE